MYKKLNIKSYQSLLELRKNPEKNIYVGAWDYLEKYKNDPDVYISFTEIDKIGINPRSEYNTPIGIYCYPLKEFYNKYIYPNIRQSTNDSNAIKNTVIKYEKSIGSFAPFAGNAKYINFIKCKNKPSFIEDMYKDYGSNNFDRDIKILEKKYSSFFGVSSNTIKKIHKKILSLENKIIIDDIPFYTNIIVLTFINIYKNNEKSLDFIEEAIYLTLFSSETSKSFKIFKNFYNWFVNRSNSKELFSSFDNIVKEAIRDTKERNPIMTMWNITRYVAYELAGGNEKGQAVKWNLILSKDLGYSGFADKSGKGYIHPSEPMQAVFLNTRAFDLITREKNIPSKNIKT